MRVERSADEEIRRLPVWSHREELLQHIQDNRVTCLQGGLASALPCSEHAVSSQPTHRSVRGTSWLTRRRARQNRRDRLRQEHADPAAAAARVGGSGRPTMPHCSDAAPPHRRHVTGATCGVAHARARGPVGAHFPASCTALCFSCPSVRRGVGGGCGRLRLACTHHQPYERGAAPCACALITTRRVLASSRAVCTGTDQARVPQNTNPETHSSS